MVSLNHLIIIFFFSFNFNFVFFSPIIIIAKNLGGKSQIEEDWQKLFRRMRPRDYKTVTIYER